MEKLCGLYTAKGFISGILVSTVDILGASHISPLSGQFIHLSVAVGVVVLHVLKCLEGYILLPHQGLPTVSD